MPRRLLAAFFVATSALVGCGGDDPAPSFASFEEACAAVDGCGESRPGRTEAIWRLEVFREGPGRYRLGTPELIDVPEGDGIPAGPLDGEVALVGRDATGAEIDGQVLAFPTEIHFENELEGGRVAETLVGETSTMGYVRASGVETLALITPDGTALIEMAPPAAILADEVGHQRSALQQASSACPHVLLLDQGSLLDFATTRGRVDIPIVDPGPMQQALVHAALHHATPALCHSIGRIAFVQVPDQPGLGGQVWTAQAGDLILINVNREEGLAKPYEDAYLQANPQWRPKMMRTLLHEAGHAAEALLNEVSAFSADDHGQWLRNSRGLAAQTIGSTRLRKGMEREWARLHAGFADVGWAEPYPPSLEVAVGIVGDYDAEQTAQAGAMSRYGATSATDDIAELVAWTTLGAVFEAAGIPADKNEREDYGCQAMATYEGDGVPSRYAAVYSKLHFLRDLGLVSAADVERCVGRVSLDATPEGMRFFTGDEAGRVYDQDVQGVIGRAGGRYVFEMVSSGTATFDDTDYPATATLRVDLDADESTALELISWPRGVYRLAPGAPNTFTLVLDGEPAGDFEVTDGFAYVAESSDALIDGGVFIREAFRFGAPVPVPQVFDPPLNVRFRIEN